MAGTRQQRRVSMYPCICIRTTIHSDVKAEHIKHTFYIFNCSSVFELELYFLRTFISLGSAFRLFFVCSRNSSRKMLTHTHTHILLLFIPLLRLLYLLVLIRLFYAVRASVHHCLCTRSTVDIVRTHTNTHIRRDRWIERVCVRQRKKQLTNATRENSKANRKKKYKTSAYIL